MKLTISQEGMNPITIKTASEKNIRSQEDVDVEAEMARIEAERKKMREESDNSHQEFEAKQNEMDKQEAAFYDEFNKTKDKVNKASGSIEQSGKIIMGGTAVMASLMLAMIVKVIGGTIYNKTVSIGVFNSGNEMLESTTLKNKLSQIASKYSKPYPQVQEVKNDPRARSKSTFLGWLLGGASRDKVMQNAGSVNMLLKQVDGIPVSVVSIVGPTTDDYKVLIATAYFFKNGKIVSVPLARGFLNCHKFNHTVNPSRECADVYFGNNCTFTKNQILKKVNAENKRIANDMGAKRKILYEYTI